MAARDPISIIQATTVSTANPGSLTVTLARLRTSGMILDIEEPLIGELTEKRIHFPTACVFVDLVTLK
jgi:hypothetical protein